MASKYNFKINKGATKIVEIDYTDSEDNPKDLTDYKARMQLRTTPDSDNVELELNSESFTSNRSTILITPESGSLRIYIAAADSDEFTSVVYFYDLEIYTDVDPFEKSDPEYVERLLEGVITTTANITR